MIVGNIRMEIQKGAQKAVYEGPKFVKEELQIAKKQAEITKAIRQAKKSTAGVDYVYFAKEVTVKPIVKAAKAIKQGVIAYVDGVKSNLDILTVEKVLKNKKVAKLNAEKSKVLEDFNARTEDTARYNARADKAYAEYKAEQVIVEAIEHVKKEIYYDAVGTLDLIKTQKQALLAKLEKLEKIEKATDSILDYQAPNLWSTYSEQGHLLLQNLNDPKIVK